MNARIAGVVLKKEITDLLRDRRTLITSLLLPILLFPLLYAVLGGSIRSSMDKVESGVRVGYGENVTAGAVRDRLEEMLSGAKGISFVEGNALALLKDGKLDAVVDVASDAQTSLEAGMPMEVTVISDSIKSVSTGAAEVVGGALNAYSQKVTNEKLAQMGIDLRTLRPVVVASADLTEFDPGVQRNNGNMMLSGMLPVLLLTFLAVGGAAVACDLVAGEKERQTLEPLLATSADRASILIGKYFTVVLFSIVSGACTVLGVLLSLLSGDAKLIMGDVGATGIAALPMFLLLFIILGMALTFSAIQLTISAYARTLKEAQTYTGLMPMAVMLPAYATMFSQAGDFTPLQMWIPVIGQIGMVKLLLAGIVSWPHLVGAIGGTLVLLAAALFVSFRMMGKEKALIRG